MAYRCELCDKKTRMGRQNRHHPGVAGAQWKHRAQTTIRAFKPNLHWVTLPFNGATKRVRACAKCIKRVRFDMQKTAALSTTPTAVTTS